MVVPNTGFSTWFELSAQQIKCGGQANTKFYISNDVGSGLVIKIWD